MIDSIAVGLINLAIGISVRHYWSVFRSYRRTRGQGAILFGLSGSTSTKFVFPPRKDVDTVLLPRISVEDFMAINNLISSFISSKKIPPHKYVDSDSITEQDKKQNNLVIICSSKTNKVTEEALALLVKAYSGSSILIPIFETDNNTGRIHIAWNKGIYPSESFEQQGPDYTDIAMIVKARNPWAGQHKILIVAGIRGIGTWGAAEFIKKWVSVHHVFLPKKIRAFT